MTIHPAPAPVELSFADVREHLAEAATERRRQLSRLPERVHDPVAGAHKASVERTLTEIQAAQERLEAGTYGCCLGCHAPIAAGRLALVPWADSCVRCIRR